LVLKKLSDDPDVSIFTSSDSEDLEDFLRTDAKNRQDEKISTTYLVHSGTELVGFFSLSMGCIVSDHVRKMVPVRWILPDGMVAQTVFTREKNLWINSDKSYKHFVV
jgi:hypothetical protein